MKNLRPETMEILKRVETLSGCPVEFKPDSSLSLRATLQMAREGAPAHVLRYRPSNDPIDYWVAYQAGYALRLFDLPPNERFNFTGTGEGAEQVEALLATGQPLSEADKAVLPEFAKVTLQWALLNLRSYAIGMRIDQWIAREHPSLREMQVAGVDSLQQENLQLLSKRVGRLSVPVPLLAPVAACALFADRLLGTSVYAIPYRAAGALEPGTELLRISDTIGSDRRNDRELVDAWASSIGMTGWYTWTPYKL
ncbi:hypothetical protein [Polaromonas sp. C04]|uniref:hypothetical protein n=1 Tax=Polaromonas sp. C04 TaxID=1945857 RepID=UPI0011872EBB|nr:hypothetical protein [Polaromonas sp. C04]